MYKYWLTLVAEGHGTSKSRMRSVMAEAQSKRSVKKTNEYKQEQNRTEQKKKRKEKK
jgi:hypothetical protein